MAIGRQVREMGHNVVLPMLGAARTEAAGTVSVDRSVNQTPLDQAVAALADRVNHGPKDALPVVVGDQVRAKQQCVLPLALLQKNG